MVIVKFTQEEIEMATEDQISAEQLNEGLNTPTDDDDGYGQEAESESKEESTEGEGEDETTGEDSGEEVKAKADDTEDDDEPKPLTRGQQRIQALANERKLAEQRAELLERQLQQERQQRHQPRPQEEENLSDLEKWQRQADQTIRQVQFQNMDMQDRSDFIMLVSKNPTEAAYLDRVEQMLAEARKTGINPKREDVLIRLMGMDARAKMRSAPALKATAAKNVKAAQGKPLVNKSNVAATKTESTEFDRLKGITL